MSTGDHYFAPRCEYCYVEMEIRFNSFCEWWECPSHPFVKTFVTNVTTPLFQPPEGSGG